MAASHLTSSDDQILASDVLPLQRVIIEFVLARSPEFRHLHELRKLGWASPEGDAIFQQERQRADKPTRSDKNMFYKMTLNISNELHQATKAFRVLQSSEEPMALDMGMAPGGFSATILKQYPNARVRAITLPHSEGGHAVQFNHRNLKLDLRDINTLAGDLGHAAIPATHREAEGFTAERTLDGERYDIVICGGQVTRNQEKEEWREAREPRRLELAQLVIALKHIKPSGTLIFVSHKPESLHTIQTLRSLSLFSDVRLFKPRRAHAKRSSFYIVAKNVESSGSAAIEMVKTWTKEWMIATRGTDEEDAKVTYISLEDVQHIIEEFGEKLVKLGRPIWMIQAKALEQAIKRWKE